MSHVPCIEFQNSHPILHIKLGLGGWLGFSNIKSHLLNWANLPFSRLPMHLWTDASAALIVDDSLEIPFCLFAFVPLWRVLYFSKCVKTSKELEFCFCGYKTHLNFTMCWLTLAQ